MKKTIITVEQANGKKDIYMMEKNASLVLLFSADPDPDTAAIEGKIIFGGSLNDKLNFYKLLLDSFKRAEEMYPELRALHEAYDSGTLDDTYTVGGNADA